MLEEMVEFVLVELGFMPMITETVTTKEEDDALDRVGTGHREGRAFDIRSSDWKAQDVRKFMDYFNLKYGKLGAVAKKSGVPTLIVHHNAGTGMHLHVQLNREFVSPFVSALNQPKDTPST